MKYLIASDLHGSGSCTRQLLERFAAEGADMLVLLGDLLYHGPRNNLPGEYDPKIVSALLNEHNNHSLPPLATPRTILLHGHTHIPANETFSTHRYMNPGSTTLPKQGSPQSYMLIDGNDVYWKHLADGTVYMQDVLNKEE